jgi:riboflavin kinase/FMN adenylyltransferase
LVFRKYSSEFEVQEVSALEKDGRIISSSWIRELVKAGNVTKAGELLGRLYFASGEVVAGDARGRELRVPTANLKTARECLPLPGVYVSVFEDLLTGHAFASVTNLGFRPTFGEGGLKLETHLLNFRDDLYGRKSRVFFLERIREERKFSDVSSLRSQLVLDLTNASKYFQRHKLMRLDPEKSSLTLGRVDPLTQNFQSALFLKGL